MSGAFFSNSWLDVKDTEVTLISTGAHGLAGVSLNTRQLARCVLIKQPAQLQGVALTVQPMRIASPELCSALPVWPYMAASTQWGRGKR